MEQLTNRLRSLDAQRVLVLIFVATTILGVAMIAIAFYQKANTGTLTIKTSEATSMISVSQIDKTAAVIGTGKATARLKAGTYRVAATMDKQIAVVVVTISKGSNASASLTLSSAQKLRTADDITFENFDSLIDSGITESQIDQLQHSFFKFKPQTNAIFVDANTINPGPRDLVSANPISTMTFTVDVDDSQYFATISYADLDNARLELRQSPTGPVVFDSNPPTAESSQE